MVRRKDSASIQTFSRPVNMDQYKKSRPDQYSRVMGLEALLSRTQLAGNLGYQYGTDRDIYKALGYPLTIEYEQYAARYERQDIAKAIIDRPVDATWSGEFGILESDDDEDTALELAWEELEKKLHMKSIFSRLDRLSCIGRYGVLLLGLSDVKTRDDFRRPISDEEKLELLYVKPLAEGSAEITDWERDESKPRFGKPTIYQITIRTEEGLNESQIYVHYTRLIHVVPEPLESDVEGVPAMKPVYNRLVDLEKITGGSGEMFWRGGRPGFGGEVKEDYKITDTTMDELQDELDEYEHNLRRFLVHEGINFKPFQVQVADPEKHVDIQIQMISAETGIPKRVLTGSERGEQASSQDRDNWFEKIKGRRENYTESRIVRPFVDFCIVHQILPPPAEKPDNYSVKWQPLFELSEKERTEIGKNRAESTAKIASSPGAEVLLPPSAFYRHCLGLDEDDIELIEEEHKAAIAEEEKQNEIERKLMEEQMTSNPPVPPNQPERPGSGTTPPQASPVRRVVRREGATTQTRTT
jgi:hypothetical protein